MKQRCIHLTLLLLLFSTWTLKAKLVEYSFDIDHHTINVTGKDVSTISFGKQISGPTIEASLGDTLRVTFHNKLDENTPLLIRGPTGTTRTQDYRNKEDFTVPLSFILKKMLIL